MWYMHLRQNKNGVCDSMLENHSEACEIVRNETSERLVTLYAKDLQRASIRRRRPAALHAKDLQRASMRRRRPARPEARESARAGIRCSRLERLVSYLPRISE